MAHRVTVILISVSVVLSQTPAYAVRPHTHASASCGVLVYSSVFTGIHSIGHPAVWGFLSLGSTHCDRVFLLSEVHL